MNVGERIERFLDRGEDYPTEPVPREARKNWWSIGIVWIGVYICVPSIMEGLMLVGGLPFWEAVAADLTGIVTFLILMLIVGNIGTKTGLTTYMIARESFGHYGSHIVSVIAAIGGFGWFAILTRSFGESMVALLGYGNVSLICFIGGLTMMLTAIFGYRGIEALSYPAVIYTFITMIAMAVRSIIVSPLSFSEAIAQTPMDGAMGFAAAVSMVVGGMAMAVVVAPDVNRFAKSFGDNVKALLCLTLPVAVLQPLASMIIGIYTGTSDLGVTLATAGGVFGIILVVLGAWTTCDNDLYSGSLAISEIFPKIKRWRIALFFGVLSSFLSAFIDLQQYADIMYVFNAFAIPVAGVIITDFYILPRIMEARRGSINVPAVIALLVGVVVEASMDFGLLPPTYIPPPIITILLSSIVYVIGMGVSRKIR